MSAAQHAPADRVDSTHPQPFICTTRTTQSLHFHIDEVQSRMRLRQPDALVLAYTRTMMGFLLFQPQATHLLMIGLGGGSLAKFCFRHLPQVRLRVVEINPHVIALRQRFRVPPDDARFTVERADGCAVVAAKAAQTDVLLVDGYDGKGVAAGLVSDAFYAAAFRALRPDGVLVVNLPGREEDTTRAATRMAAAFAGQVRMVEDQGGYNTVVFAVRGSALQRRLDPAACAIAAGLGSVACEALAAAFAKVAGTPNGCPPAA